MNPCRNESLLLSRMGQLTGMSAMVISEENKEELKDLAKLSICIVLDGGK